VDLVNLTINITIRLLTKLLKMSFKKFIEIISIKTKNYKLKVRYSLAFDVTMVTMQTK